MKSGDDSSDLDDLPLSSLGVKTATNSNQGKKKAQTTDNTSPPNKKIKSEKSIATTKSDDKVLKKSTNAKSNKKSPSPAKKKKSPSPKKKETPAKASKNLKEKKTRKSEQAKKKDSKKKSSTKKSSKTELEEPVTSSISTKTIITASSQLYSASDKGKLIQNVLCRWWYCYTWPDPNSIPSTTPPNADALDGFPGVYVVTSGPNVGQIMDFRNQDKCPNFKNFAKKTSDELKSLLFEAIAKQKAALIEAEGSGTDTEERLNDLQKWATKINGPKADKEADKILRAMNLVL